MGGETTMSNPTPEPNEVMDVDKQASDIAEQILQDHRLWVNGSWNYNGDDPRQKGAKTIAALVAQQNAALLRELQQHDTIYHYQRGVGEGFFHAIPASILEAKLNEINKEVI
jgi:N12 class adenine-specific DNA methylase